MFDITIYTSIEITKKDIDDMMLYDAPVKIRVLINNVNV